MGGLKYREAKIFRDVYYMGVTRAVSHIRGKSMGQGVQE
jgi:hypothetical protein